ncbi:phage scaffolding protein [Amycolatopsis orientalis]|uniref:phage scaffolding protein n=1 Tax=Amycolatopsis orientalis TaxID=31958 RepID=UPI0003A7D1C2|nr:hypothetical protein [Amycolatopsis orientalis]
MAEPENDGTNPEVDETEGTGSAAETEDTDAPLEGEDALGDKGKKALDAMKAERNQYKQQLREARKELEALKAPQPKAGEQPDLDALTAKAEAAALEKANTRIIRAEIRAAAAGKLADVSDAVLNIDPSQFEVDKDGNVDQEEIADAIADLLTRKPHLAGTATGRFQGSADQGARKQPARPSQLTRAELAKMSPAAIMKAKAEGRLNDLYGIK